MLNPDQIEYGPDYKYGFEAGRFGFGQMTGNFSTEYPEEVKVSRARKLGWAHGCPTAIEVIDKYGVDWITQRYSSCNFWFNWVTMEARVKAQLGKPKLYQQLTTPTLRLPQEPLKEHSPLCVPESHKTVISPMSGLFGYAIPRLIILKKDALSGTTRFEDREREAINLMRTSIDESASLKVLTASLVKELYGSSGIEPIELFSHALPQGILDEENCHTTYGEFADQLIKTIPQAVKFYQELTPAQKAEKGIADVPALR